MDEIVDFEVINNQEKTSDNTVVKQPVMNGSFIIFATVDMKTDEVTWMDSVKSIIEPLEYKDELNQIVLDDFVSKFSYALVNSKLPTINFSDNMLYAYEKYIKEEFMERFRWYFEEYYPARKPLTQGQKELYLSMLLNNDETCKNIEEFGEELLGHTLNVIFFNNHYWMVGIKENEIMDSHQAFWKLGDRQENAKEYLVDTYLHRKYSNKNLPNQYANLLSEISHYYDLYEGALHTLGHKLKLEHREMSEFRNFLDNDLLNDGGTNNDSTVKGYWTYKMVEQELKKYKSSGIIPK
jgi:hypothetical protein